MHRIGRTGRAEQIGKSILFYTEKEVEDKEAIEALMKVKIPKVDFPQEVEVSSELTPEERPKIIETSSNPNTKLKVTKGAFHEKSEKNKKVNQGGSYKFKMKNYKKPKTRGDKNMNKKGKKR